MTNAGRAPVAPSRAVQPAQTRQQVAQENYLTVVNTLRENNGAEAKAIRAMFGGDRALMDRFLAVAFSLLAKNSRILEEATPMSIVQAIKDAASLGLEPLTDDGAIVVYNHIAQFQPMWRGYVKRIRNSGKVTDIDTGIVYANDAFRFTLGTDVKIEHTPALADRGDYWGAYAIALMPSGKYLADVMTVADINQVRDNFSQAYKNRPTDNPWVTSWSEMARKTAIRRLAKRLPGAAVDSLLEMDLRADKASDEQAKLIASTRDELAEVRSLALRAVNDPSAGPEAPPPALEAGAATAADTPENEAQRTSEAAIIDEPGVAAAMDEAEEQLRRQRERRP